MLKNLKAGRTYKLYANRYGLGWLSLCMPEKSIAVFVTKDLDWALGTMYHIFSRGRTERRTSIWINLTENELIRNAYMESSCIELDCHKPCYAFGHPGFPPEEKIIIRYDFEDSSFDSSSYTSYKFLRPDGSIYYTNPIAKADYNSMFDEV